MYISLPIIQSSKSNNIIGCQLDINNKILYDIMEIINSRY